MTLDLGPIKERAERATEGHWHPTVNDYATIDDAVNDHRKCLEASPSLTVRGVMAWDHPETVIGPNPERPELATMICLNGNGPAGYANADFIAEARADIPALVAEVEALRAALGAEREACDALHAEFVHYYTLAWCKDDEIGRAIEKRAKAAIERHDARRAPKIGGGE